MLPLKYRREINDLVFFFKCVKNIYYLNIFDYVSFRSCTKPLKNVDLSLPHIEQLMHLFDIIVIINLKLDEICFISSFGFVFFLNWPRL